MARTNFSRICRGRLFLKSAIVCLVSSAVVSATEYQCNSCATCRTQIVSAVSGDVVKLTTDVVESTSTCISITNKIGLTFDCQGHEIAGPFTGGVPAYFFGIELNGSSSSTIKNCTVRNFYENIRASSSSSNTFDNLTSETAFQNGIFLQQSNNNTITRCTLFGNLNRGVYVYSGVGNNLVNITATSNLFGAGIDLGSGNTIDGLQARGSTYGVTLAYTTNNTIKNSRIEGSSDSGIYFSPGFNGTYVTNTIVYNNYLSNTVNFSNRDANNQPNVFNTTLNCNAGPNIVGGACIGGNFWSNASRTAFSDTCEDPEKDGICNAAYTPYAGNADNYPLSTLPIAPGRPTNLRTVGG